MASSVFAEPIKVGMSLALSGASADLGKSMYRASKKYFDHINKQGGINGQLIEIIAYDDAYDPRKCVQNTIRLVEDDQVDLLYGYVGTPTVTRMLPLLKHYRDRNLYLFFPFTGAGPQRTPPYDDYVFNLRASYLQETGGLVKNFLSIGRNRVAVFFQNDGYGKTGWVGVYDELKKHNLEIVSEATYKRGESYNASYKRQVELILEGEPDAIVCIGSYQACAGFIRDLRREGDSSLVANISFVGVESLLEILQNESQHSSIDFTQNLVSSMTVPIKDHSVRATKDFYWLMGYTSDQQFNAIEFEAFLNARFLVHILRRIEGEFDSSKILTAAHQINDYDLGIGIPITLNESQHQALNQVYYITAKNGHFEPLKDWSVWKK